MVDQEEKARRAEEARARKAIAQKRKHQAFKMRSMGLPFKDIGEQLGVSKAAAHKAYHAALAEIKRDFQKDAQTIIILELQTLSDLQRFAYAKASEGHIPSIREIREIIKLKITLQDAMPPEKVAPTTPDGKQPYRPVDPDAMSDKEMLERIAELAKEDPEMQAIAQGILDGAASGGD